MMCWAKDPELFLHKGRDGIVRVRRCMKETTSTSSMLMKHEDLKDEGEVTDHRTLYGGYYDWDIKMYKALIDYIYPKHLLVNYRGSVIVELATDDKAAPVVYIRALDILAMGSYGPRDRAVPARTVKYLQDGTDVRMCPNPKETKLTEDLEKKTKEAATLQQELATEKNKNKALGERNAELEEANKKCGAKPPTVRIYTAADTGYSLTIRDGHVILGLNDLYDVYQYWVKDDKYGATVKDVSGLPSYALVNKFTGEALKAPSAAMEDVQLVPYNPDILDRSILWSEHEQGDGYRAIRSTTHTSLNLDAHGGIRDGTTIKVWNWLAVNNQRWNIIPCSMPEVNPSEPTKIRIYTKADTGYSLTIRDGHVILAPYNRADICQYWVKYDKYATNVKDKDGLPSFALVNSFTGQAIKHSMGSHYPVRLVPYNPDVVDESILWTECPLGDGYSFIRMVSNIGLILDACSGDKTRGGEGVHDGTEILLLDSVTGDNQHWKMVP